MEVLEATLVKAYVARHAAVRIRAGVDDVGVDGIGGYIKVEGSVTHPLAIDVGGHFHGDHSARGVFRQAVPRLRPDGDGASVGGPHGDVFSATLERGGCLFRLTRVSEQKAQGRDVGGDCRFRIVWEDGWHIACQPIRLRSLLSASRQKGKAEDEVQQGGEWGFHYVIYFVAVGLNV